MAENTRVRNGFRMAGLIAAAVLILGGVGGCQATKVERWACVGSAFECDAGYIPGYGWAIGVAGVVGGLILAWLAVRPTSAEQVKIDAGIASFRSAGLALVKAAGERDENRCRECGSTAGTEVYFIDLIPSRAHFTDPNQLVSLCTLHAKNRRTAAQVFSS